MKNSNDSPLYVTYFTLESLTFMTLNFHDEKKKQGQRGPDAFLCVYFLSLYEEGIK